MTAPNHERRDRSKLGGLKHRQLVRELATGDLSQSELARKYDVSDAAITKFKQRNADEIEAVRAHADDEFAGILIANKAARLSLYEEIVMKAMTSTPKVDNKGAQIVDPETGEPVYEFDGRTALAAAKQAAEELGQLPTRVQVSGDMTTTTTYKIEGIDPTALM